MSKHTTITILGSTKFQNEIEQYAWDLTKKGFLVLFAPFAKEKIKDLEQYRDVLESLHFQKIRMSNEVLVFDKNGYIGEHTKLEINYAEVCKIPLIYLSDLEKFDERGPIFKVESGNYFITTRKNPKSDLFSKIMEKDNQK